MVIILKRLLIILMLLVFGFAVYFLYTTFLSKRQFHPVDVVSAEAIFVYETLDPVFAWNTLVSQPIWKRMAYLPSLKQLENQLLALDSLAGRSGNLENALKGRNFAVSLHQTGKGDFDFLFSIAIPGGDQKDFVESLVERIDPILIQTRSYSGIRIYEYQSQAGGPALSYTLVGNLILATYSSFLIEDAIRHTETDDLKSFKKVYAELYQSYPEPMGLGILRLSSAGLAKFMQGISSGKNLRGIENFSQSELSANLELKFDQNKIVFEGVSFFGEGEKLNLNWGEDGLKNPFSNYITNRTAIYHQYDVASPYLIQDIPNNSFEMKSTLQGEIEKGFQEELFLGRLTGEIGLMVLEYDDQMNSDRILLMRSKETANQIKILKEFNTSLLGVGKDPLNQNYYLGREIIYIGAEDFPAHIFKGNFVGFQNTYVLAFEDMIVMGNSSRSIKVFLEDVYNDNTWGKSIPHTRFMESLPTEFPYRFIINVQRFWSSLLAESSPEWKVFFQKYAPQFKSVDWLTLQRNDHSTLVEIPYSLDSIKTITDIVLAEKMSVQFREKLLYGPKSFQNFIDKSSDYLVQDEQYEVHLVTGEGDIIFSKPLGGEIVGEVFQIDFFKNGKLQLLFATENAIFAIDRLGLFLPGYPIYLPSGSVINHLNLLDYNNSLEYRYFVGTEKGDLYLLDQFGNYLEGWDPKNIAGAPASKPAHYRIPGKGDYMIATSTSGELYLMNRKGELQTGNPIKLGRGLATDYAIVESGGNALPQIVTINDEGEVVKVNFNGELTYRNQLLRPDRSTRFHLVKDQSQNRYLFVLHEYNKISVMNAESGRLFEKEIFSDDLSFQFFSFGAGKNIFVVIDKVQEFIYLYNLQGQLLNSRPINGHQNLEVKYSGSKNEYSILAIHEDRLTEYKMPL